MSQQNGDDESGKTGANNEPPASARNEERHSGEGAASALQHLISQRDRHWQRRQEADSGGGHPK